MAEKFSNWLLDIAKYIMTVLILTTALRDLNTFQGWQYYAVCAALVFVVIVSGVILHYIAVKQKKNVKQSNN